MAEARAAQLIKTHDGASSSSSAALESQYQVFLSFRGEDTRKNFTDYLYCSLTGAGIRTFRDNEELRVGKEIQPDLLKAIEESTISIPIFSKGYASSKWCLMELTHMVKCMNSSHGHTICPIFYGVTPSDVRHQTGNFHEAFVQHKKKFGETIVKEWKEALKQAADLKGWERDKVADGHEGELVYVVASEICMKLGRNHVKLTDKLVGMDHHLEKMKQLLDLNCDDVRVIGIHGMGGIGKTTIAKFLFNELGINHFQQKCSFLENICEKVKQNRNYGVLRNQLISDILKRKPDGINLNSKTFKDTKVLIVLDDVEDTVQLSEIIENRDWFGMGSRIIVTTRNKKVFEEWDGYLIYEPSGMAPDDSLLLFCKHAFRSTQPQKGYEEISREVVQTAAGLPLSLVVIGSMLFLKKRKQWEDTLKKLKTIPAVDVQKRLKISYDTLEPNQKQMFLDIACHFIGQEKTYAMYMWDACEFFPESCDGIDVLVSLSLMTIENIRDSVEDRDMDIFRMHDQLRDLGRNIVYQENPNDPGQRSRLWSNEEARKVLDDKSGTRLVQTLSVNYGSDYDRTTSSDDIKGLSRLRYLSLVGPRMEGNFNRLVSNLTWLRWSFKDPTALLHLGKSIMTITNFRANKLVILDLSESDIWDGWESWIQIKTTTNLKVLNLSSCSNLTKLPECLWNMKLLVELDLSHTGIAELSEQGIGNLTNLIKLLLSRSMIKRLPYTIGKLKKLEVLDCSFCKSLEGQLPEGIGRLSFLRVLNLFRTQVDKLPENVGSLCNLRKLYLSGTHIKKLPGMGIEKLQNLEELNCSHCTCLDGQLPEGIWRLSSLRALNLSFTKADGLLKNIVRRCNSRNLDVSDTDIKKLGVSYEMLQKLEDLNYYPWPLKRELTDAIESLSSLRVLDKIADSSTQERSNLEMKRKLEDGITVDDEAPSSTTSRSTHEVFLSFRGADIRLSFADHLYNYLSDVGVQTFRDNEKLRVGEEIGPDLMKSQRQQKAMEESSISIPIFSKGYASSEWCLMELTHMVKCMKSYYGHTIWPIFYDVTPWDVRYQTGSFAQAFLQHTKKFDEPIIQEWKDALEIVGKLKGWEKDKFAKGHEAGLIKQIVTDVSKKLKKCHVQLTADLVGMDRHIEEMTKLLNINNGNGVRIVGIVGMGGIGKTTIAKFMYNKLCDQFRPQCSFLKDVREKIKFNNDSAELRKQLISDVLKCQVDSTTIEINAFRDKKVLIVLDDVVNRSQLKGIIGHCEYFGSGSTIIVTTRNKEVFEEWNGDLIYEPSGMDFDDSLLLFCKHAFDSTQPREGYEDISREVVQIAAGLPLSLVVIGSMLHSKERREYWEAVLKKLKTGPAPKVQERLKISYDALRHYQQEMFLDIACHFIGQDITYAIHMWEDCGFFPECDGIDVLVSQSLITIEKFRNSNGDYMNIFRMHDQLRDLGRDIVKKENRSHPGQRSRLWSIEEAREVLDNKSGTRVVQTLSVNYRWDSDCSIISNDDFEGLSSLRYLSLEGPTLKGDFKGLFSNLRWFRWRFKDSTDLGWFWFGFGKSRMRVTNFCANKLVVLDLSESDIWDGWESWIQIKTATNLKVLKLSGCRHLTKLPECLWNMKSLMELDLSNTVITELSEQGIGNLTNLIKLILYESTIKRLPDAIGKLEKLEVLNCSNCRSLEGKLPEGIRRLSSLRVLNLFNTNLKHHS